MNDIEYKYSIKNELLPIDILFKEPHIKDVYIYAYKIDRNGKYPFLKIVLEKKDNLYSFPRFILQKEYHSLYIIDVLQQMMRLLITKQNIRWNEQIDGIYKYNNNYYLFIDLSETIELGDMNVENNVCFALIDEIINIRHIFETKINDKTTDFLLNNNQLCYLTNNQDETYETPVIAYICEKSSQLQFQCTFGVSTKDKEAILGSYYYFTNYENAMLHLLLKIDENEIINGINKDIIHKYGLIRFALFLGRTNIIIPKKQQLDNSQTKIHRILDPARLKHIELITQHISDHDGNWTLKYDSCFLGNIKLENVIQLKNNPIYVVKEYNQQIGLTYKLL